MFHVTLNRIPKSWKDENILAAQMIYEDCVAHNEIPYIFFSGGLDSNAVAESFRLAKVPYKIFIMRYNNGLNDYDIQFAIDWCKAYNIEYILYDIDYVKFLESEKWRDIAIESRLTSPHQLLYLHAATNLIDGYPVIGYGEPDLTREDIEPGVKNAYKIHVMHYSSFQKYFENRRGSPIFFHHTPEQQLSWFFENRTIDFVGRRKYITPGDNYVDHVDKFTDCIQCHKNDFYRESYPNLVKRPQIINHNEWKGHKRRSGKPMTDYTGFDRLPKDIFNLECEVREVLEFFIEEFEDIWCKYDKYINKALAPKFINYYNEVMEKVENGI